MRRLAGAVARVAPPGGWRRCCGCENGRSRLPSPCSSPCPRPGRQGSKGKQRNTNAVRPGLESVSAAIARILEWARSHETGSTILPQPGRDLQVGNLPAPGTCPARIESVGSTTIVSLLRLLADLHQCTDGPSSATFRWKAAGTRPPEGQSQGVRQDPTENTGRPQPTSCYSVVCVKTAVSISEDSRFSRGVRASGPVEMD